MRHLAALILAAILSTGCGSRHGGRPVTVTPFIGPDGSSRWLALKCKRGMGDCYAEVGDWCPSGYDVGDKAQSSEAPAASLPAKGRRAGPGALPPATSSSSDASRCRRTRTAPKARTSGPHTNEAAGREGRGQRKSARGRRTGG